VKGVHFPDAPAPEAARLLTATPARFTAAAQEAMEKARGAIARLKALPQDAGAGQVLSLWDEATAALGDASAQASVARNAHPDPAMRTAAEECEQDLDALGTALSLDRAIYDVLCRADPLPLDAASRHYLTRTLRDFRRGGVDRDEATRARIQALSEELVRIGQEFSRNIREDVRHVLVAPAELAGLPADYRRAHPPGPDGMVRISTDTPDYVPFITYSESRRAREALWRVYRQRAHPKNLEVLGRLLSRRHELAGLLGHRSWAAYVTEDKMIGSAEAAHAFIARIAEASAARAARDQAALVAERDAALAKGDEAFGSAQDAGPLQPWDAELLKERVRRRTHGFDAQSVRPWFEFGRVQQGLLGLTAKLFGLEYRKVEDAPVWHPQVTCFDVFEEGERVGRFYLDLHPREGKYKHAAQFTLASGKAGVRLPEAALICNFPGPFAAGAGGGPALLEHSEVVTFFHEFGHLLHHLLGGRTRWAGLSGVRTEWDFVEAPSQMLEEWCWDPAVLATFARHHFSGEVLPAKLALQMRAAAEFGKGLQVRQQMFYAALSLAFHDRDPGGLDTTALTAELQGRYTPFQYVPGTYFQESFGHLEGYSAIYYTYMWSLVIAKDLLTGFSEGLLAEGPARRYRRAILEPGGSRPAAALVKEFLGRDSDFRAWQRWIEA
jgi:thimet oligopeptidase